jgi:hypothetical protein
MYSVSEVVVDARQWHWFIPARASMKASDVVYDIKSFADFASEMGASPENADLQQLDPANPDRPQASPLIDPGIMQILTKYGLDKPSLDFALGWDWNPNSGAIAVNTGFGLDNYMHLDMTYEGDMPSFKSVSDLVPGGFETAKGDEISALFAEVASLKGFELLVHDEGGLDRIFALVAEAGKMMPPDQTGGVAVFANATPDSLRQMAKAGVDMAADQVETMAPGGKALVAPFAAFLEQGGKVRFTLKPKTPLVYAAKMEEMRSGNISPLQLIVQLGGKTVHTPPAPAKP